MNFRKHPRAVLAVLVPIALLLTGCSGSAAKGGNVDTPPSAAAGDDPLAPMPLEKKVKVTFAMSSKLEAFAPALLAEHFGEFEKENLDVEFVFVPPAESTLLVAQGKVDVGSGAYTAGVYNLVGQGSPFRFVFPGVSQPEGSTQGFWMNNDEVEGDGENPTADMFVGPKILTPSGDGSPSAVFFYDWVKSLPGGEDVKAKDLNLEMFDSTQAGQALISGSAGIAQVNSPHDRVVKDSDCCTFLDGAVAYETTNSAYFFGPSMDGRADVGAAVVRSLARTVHEYLPRNYRKNEKTMDALAEVLELDRDTLDAIPPLYWDPEFKTFAAKNLEIGQPFFRDRGLLQYEDDLEADDLFDTKYLEAIGVSGE